MNSISLPSPDEQFALAVNRRGRSGFRRPAEPGRKVGLVLVEFDPATTPGDYPTIEAAAAAIAGVATAEIVVRGTSPRAVDGKQCVVAGELAFLKYRIVN